MTKGAGMPNLNLQRLARIDLFAGCRRSQLERIDSLGSALTLPPGRTLCYEGEPGSEFFVLIDGVVEVRRVGRTVARLHTGAWFGETALVNNTPRQAGVTTLLESALIVFGRREFNTLRHVSREVGERLDATAALFAAGGTPTSWVWYQPMDERPPAMTAVTNGHGNES